MPYLASSADPCSVRRKAAASVGEVGTRPTEQLDVSKAAELESAGMRLTPKRLDLHSNLLPFRKRGPGAAG
jgi:hypothetical protein